MARRIVAGTRLWRRPRASAMAAPGSDATRLTVIATGATTRLATNRTGPRSRRRSYRTRRTLGMNTYVLYSAPRARANPPVTLNSGVRSRTEPGIASPTGMPTASTA